MPLMPDGSFMPSNIYVNPSQIDSCSEFAFRLGKIVAVYYPDNAANYSKTFIEYDVLTDYIDAFGVHTKVMFPRCVTMSLFGGAADFTDWTYRLSDFVTNGQAQSPNGPSQTIDFGSTVGILCVNGDVRQGIIIGGLKHIGLPGNASYTPTQSSGNHMNFEFNGVVVQIDDAGQFSLTFNGKTNSDTSLASSADSNATGSNIFFSSDGSITATGSDYQQVIKIDNTNDLVEIDANTALNMNANGQVNIQSAGVVVGAGTNTMPLFSTYRLAETETNITLAASLEALSILITATSAQLATAGSLMTVPMVGAVLAAPFVTAASAQLAAAGPLFATMGIAITAFEAQTETFNSPKNFND